MLIVRKLRKESWQNTGISTFNLKPSILIGITLSAMLVIGFIVFDLKKAFNIITLNSLWAFIYFSIVGFGEELQFRGYLQTRLMAWLGTQNGWLFSSIIMALTHIPQRILVSGLTFADAFYSSVSLIPISLLLGYIFIKTKNILASGIFHSFMDWVDAI